MPDGKPIIVLIGGGHASGKRTTAQLLKDEIRLTVPDVDLNIELMDISEYKGETCEEQYSSSQSAAITLPTISDKPRPPLRPSRFKFDKLREDLMKDSENPHVQQSIFIVHGLYALYDKDLRDLSQMKVFLTSDPDTRLIRWIRRDVLGDDKKTSLESIMNMYLQGARAEMSDFIFPTKEFADVIMPRGAESNAIKLIVDGIIPLLSQKSQTEEIHLPYGNNILRPSGDIFERERFDGQKGKFYDLT